MASPLPLSVEPMEGANELLGSSLDGVGTPGNQELQDPLVPTLESPRLFSPPTIESSGLPNEVDMPMDQTSNQGSTDMFAMYGEDTDVLNFDANVRPPPVGAEPVFPDVKPVQDAGNANTVLQEPAVAVDHSPVMGKCEFCGHYGIKEHFFSKSKRFCKVECAKKYSASNIKKRKNDRGITTKKKSVKKPAPSKKSKPEEFFTTTEAPSVLLSNDWQKKCFKWDEYLKTCSGIAAPPSCFKHAHVMSCLKDVHIGMKVEVINTGVPSYNNTENTTFWVATVIKFKHFKTLLRYEGYDDDNRADFWFDLRCPDIHPVGWCARINKPLIPPPEIKSRIKDWQGYLFKRLSGAKTFSADFLKKVQEIPHNRFQVGMKVEVADRKNLYSVMCVATIVDVVGDRLRLRYDGLDHSVAEDFWCHYLSTDIHPVGWSSLVGHQLRPPIGWKNSIAEWNKLIEKILAQDRDAPQEIFSEDATGTAQGPYAFEVGMKFEGVNPYIPNQICVLTVIKELKYNYFIAGIDSQAAYFCFHANSRNIFPPGWCEAYGISLTPPKDYPKESFDWDSYCKNTCGKKAPSILFQPHRSGNPFKPGMKLEAADLREPALVCPATVVEVRGPLLKIHFDGWDVTYDQFVDMDCLDLFPVGYSEITGHPIQPPGPRPDPYCQPGYQFEETAIHLIQPTITQKPTVAKVPKSVKEEHAAKPKQAKPPLHPEGMFFVNRRCRCGPMLNPVKFLKLPESVKGVLGGSDKHNIVRKCLQLLVSAGDNPKQVLELFSREFYQSKNHVDLDLGSTVCIEIKMKNDKRIMRRIKIASKAANVNSYIARVCQLLDCCTNVFTSAKLPAEQCESCLVRQTEEQNIDVVETNVSPEESSGVCSTSSNITETTGV